jgi:hypothetical protein
VERLPLVKDEKDGQADAGEASGVIPTQFFAEIGEGEDRKDGKSDDLLNRFELSGVEFVRADAVGGHLETVFEESDAPTGEDDLPQSFTAIFKVAIPGEGHEDVGNGEKKNCAHEGVAPEIRKLDAKTF